MTSSRPVRLASRKARKKNAMSPINTPNAVPGTNAETANSIGNPNPANRPTISNSPAMLSSVKPKNALMSPAAAHRYAGDRGTGVPKEDTDVSLGVDGEAFIDAYLRAGVEVHGCNTRSIADVLSFAFHFDVGPVSAIMRGIGFQPVPPIRR